MQERRAQARSHAVVDVEALDAVVAPRLAPALQVKNSVKNPHVHQLDS